MSNASRLFGCCLAAATVTMAGARAAAAQGGATATPPAPAAAVALEKQANERLAEPEKWESVARALERAAELRGVDDPVAVRDLLLAAAARFWVGDREAAQAAFMKAAEWSLYNGDVENAAFALARASVVAFERKDALAARELRDRAVHLARSPLLSAAQRQAIVSQFSATARAVANTR